MLATPEYMRAHYASDLENLADETKERELSNDPVGLGFVEEAKNRIQRSICDNEQLDLPKVKADIDDRLDLLSSIHPKLHSTPSRGTPLGLTGNPFIQDVGTSSSSFHPQSRPIVPNRRNVNPPSEPGSYYFYMAANGRHAFLHPLDIRILLSKFNRYSQFPPDISLQVEAYVETSVDADLRKRCKYLAHLPEGSDVVFIEADLEPIVGKEALQPFEVALRLRRNKRSEKERKEERARVRAEDSARQREIEAGFLRDIDRIDFGNQSDNFVEVEDPLAFNPDPPPPVEQNLCSGRSFAAAAKSDSGKTAKQRSDFEQQQDQNLDFDVAWQDLEDRSKNRKGRQKQLVILGGGGGRRRR